MPHRDARGGPVLGHNYIGTEHLLLALYREPDGIAARLLEASRLSADGARARVVQLCLRDRDRQGRLTDRLALASCEC